MTDKKDLYQSYTRLQQKVDHARQVPLLQKVTAVEAASDLNLQLLLDMIREITALKKETKELKEKLEQTAFAAHLL